MKKLTRKNATPIAALSGVAAIVAIAATTDGKGPISHFESESARADRSASFDRAAGAETDGAIVIGDSGGRMPRAGERPPPHTGVAHVDSQRFAKGLVIAHESLELGSWARISNLTTGEAISARVVARPQIGERAAAVLSADVASGLGFGASAEDFAVMVEPLDDSPSAATLLAGAAVYDPDTIQTASADSRVRSAAANGVAPDRYLEVGFADSRDAADALIEQLREAALADGRFGDAAVETVETEDGPRWRVRLGPVPGWIQAIEARNAAHAAGFESAELRRR